LVAGKRKRGIEPGLPWMKMYKELLSYRDQHDGSTSVPRYKENERLGGWVYKQRFQYSRGELLNERIALLESIGFQWQLVDKIQWMKMYQRLEAYRMKYKDTLVPFHYKADPQLENWVIRQRYHCKEKDRIDLLNNIGFEWKAVTKRKNWGIMYQRLLTYKKENGTTRVPSKYKADPQLRKWVEKQRQCCNCKEQIDLLNDIGFVWKPG